MKNKKTIMYCPLNDGHIVSEIQNFSQKTFEERVRNFRQYGPVTLEGPTEFQKLICSLPVIDIEQSPILYFDKVVADEDNKKKLDVFWEKNKMELDKPEIPPSSAQELSFVVAAIMQLKAKWDKEHDAKKHSYSINEKDAYTKQKLDIKGYQLQKVDIALKDDGEVSARIDLGNNVSIRLSDLTAYGDKDLCIANEYDLYRLITETDMRYFAKGTLVAPCIEEQYKVPNHLRNIHWSSSDGLYRVCIEKSDALTKLKLSEKGVEARAETVAVSRMLLGCAVRHERHFRLTIKHGLVVDIRYRDKPIFMASIPQERFITE